jgi:ABC-type uncharacterized transport system YnjBCD ATPase subunit
MKEIKCQKSYSKVPPIPGRKPGSPLFFRSVLAVVGPFKSGKSALLNLIGGRLKRSVEISGSMTINGKGLRDTWVRPTYVSMLDEALANVTVEQALVYTG